jgi:hypothetical protein
LEKIVNTGAERKEKRHSIEKKLTKMILSISYTSSWVVATISLHPGGQVDLAMLLLGPASGC